MELSSVKWFTVANEENVETKNKITKANIKAENAGENISGFAGGPEMITMVSTPDQAYGQFLSRLDEPELRKQLYGKNIYEITIVFFLPSKVVETSKNYFAENFLFKALKEFFSLLLIPLLLIEDSLPFSYVIAKGAAPSPVNAFFISSRYSSLSLYICNLTSFC